MEFSLTSEQRARLGHHLETAYPALRWNDEWQNTGLIQKIKYGVYKKMHDKVGKVGKVNSKFVKFAKFAMQIFLCSLRPDHIRTPQIFSYSLYIPYLFINY